MKLINNSNSNNHRKQIEFLLKNSEETIICVAFLKMSGLELILDKLNHKCDFYVGTDFYLTEPKALKHSISAGHNLFLPKDKKSTYHPKVYYFRNKTTVTIITGSANLTSGGLVSNFENSILIETKLNSEIDKDFKKILKLIKSISIHAVTAVEIGQYETEYILFTSKIKKAKKDFDSEISKNHSIDFSKIKIHLVEYIKDGGDDNLMNRTNNYQLAKKRLIQLSEATIQSPNEFLDQYEKIALLFHSSGLLRGKTTIAKSYKRILKCIHYIKENSKLDAGTIFDNSLPIVKKSSRFGINALTEIMNTFNPKLYSVANGRTISSLSKLGFKKYPDANNFTTETYLDYNNLIKDIAKVCKFQDLGEVDYFLSWYYEKHIKIKN